MNDERESEELPPEIDAILGGTSARVPLEMIKATEDVVRRAIVPDSDTIEQIDILTRSNLVTNRFGRAAGMCLLKSLFPFGPSVTEKRRKDGERFGIDIKEHNLSFIRDQILDIDFPITLSIGSEKSFDRVIKFFNGTFAINERLIRSGDK